MRFDDIYEEHFHNIYRYIFYMVSDTQLAEDLTQEVFLRIYKNNSKPQTIATYIRQVARHLFIDYYRKRSLIQWLPCEPHPPNQIDLEGASKRFSCFYDYCKVRYELRLTQSPQA